MTQSARQQKAGREAIRIVMACLNGHLDEVDWHRVVHDDSGSNCRSNYYLWHGGSRAFRFVELQCPRCPTPRVNMGQKYARKNWGCSGRRPEMGPRAADGSGQSSNGHTAQMIQRSAASIRMTVPITALTILDMPGRLHAILTDSRIRSAASTLESIGQLDESNFFRA